MDGIPNQVARIVSGESEWGRERRDLVGRGHREVEAFLRVVRPVWMRDGSKDCSEALGVASKDNTLPRGSRQPVRGGFRSCSRVFLGGRTRAWAACSGPASFGTHRPAVSGARGRFFGHWMGP